MPALVTAFCWRASGNQAAQHNGDRHEKQRLSAPGGGGGGEGPHVRMLEFMQAQLKLLRQTQ